jgi:hypothetical protein
MLNEIPRQGASRPMRRYLRRKVDVRVRISSQADGANPVLGRCVTVGEGGFGAILTGELSEHRQFWVEFRAPKMEEAFRVIAEVRQKRGFQYGFKFLALTREQRKHIMEIFARGLNT